MRSTWFATAGVALACVPCLLVLFVGAGIGAGALSLIGSVFSEPVVVMIAGFLAVLPFAGAAIAFARRRAEPACDTGITPSASDAGHAPPHQVAGRSRGETRT